MTFTELLEQYSIPYQTEGANTRDGWVQLDCNECGGHLYLGFNESGKYLNCWKCGPLNLVNWLRDVTGEPYNVCKTLLEGIPRDYEYIERKPKGKLVIPQGVGPLLDCHKKYLIKRGFNPDELIRLWKIQGIGLSTRLPWRIFIPIYLKGELVSWSTRSIGETGTRYVFASSYEESYPHKEMLFGEDYCRHVAIIVEGQFDVMRIGPGAVATCGTGYSPAQLRRIAKYPLRIIVFDNDLEAQRRARKLCADLSMLSGETINVTLKAKDAAEASSQEIKELRRYLR